MRPVITIERAMQLVGGKWKCLILYQLTSGPKRTRNLLSALDITQKVLTEQLRQLEKDGLIIREVFAEVSPHVEYRLSDEGLTFIPVLNMLCEWGRDYDERQGRPVATCCLPN